MCSVTPFYRDTILMFTRNPSTDERSSKNFDNVALITKEWGAGKNNDLQSMDLTLLDNSNELP